MMKHVYRSRTGLNGLCGVDIFESLDTFTVMLTELRGNRGITVTNCITELATDLALGLMDVNLIADPRSILWIEHYEGANNPKSPWNDETWDEVTMDWDGKRFRSPSWKPCAGDRFKRPPLGKSIKPHEIQI